MATNPPKEPELYAIARKFENQRAGIVNEITKAQIVMDQRRVVILTRQFLDAWPPMGQISPIENAVRAVFAKNLIDAKRHLKGTCPVCGDHMIETLCQDDVTRPYCQTCKKTYTPMGYDCDEKYALQWYAIDANERGEVVEART